MRRHLRRHLVVETEAEQPLSFRFYDPRVLGLFLRSATAAEARGFFGPVTSFFVEEGTGALIHFQRLGLAAPIPAGSRALPRIRDAQMKAFSRDLLARFVDRVAERFGAAIQGRDATRSDAHAAIHAGVARAAHHGVRVKCCTARAPRGGSRPRAWSARAPRRRSWTPC